MKIKVLQLGKFHPIKGGVEKVMMAFVLGLSSRAIRCDMLCAADDDDIGEATLNSYAKLYKTETVVKKSATMISPNMITKLRNICHDYDIIHIHHPDPMSALALFLSGYKGKVVLHWHSDILKQQVLLQLYKPLQSWLVGRADLILGTTPVYVKESRWLRKAQPKVSYLPIGVRERQAEDMLIHAIRSQYPGKKIIYSMGRLVEYKGYEYLIEAAEILGDEYVVLIGGSGPLKGKLQQQVRSLGLEERVHILGFIPKEVEAAYYAACDVYCLSSTLRTEAYAIVQVEAMSVGRPIVATKIPGSGVPWVNQDGVSGLNVEPRSAKAIAEAVRKLCSNPALYKKLSLGAKDRYRRFFTREAMIDGLLSHYQGLLG
ncbi:MAG: glycosyltransferase [Porphyromonadaceae bacterium]|nr:glycosyltransferase [Porphyromonadaceae bacterium]